MVTWPGRRTALFLLLFLAAFARASPGDGLRGLPLDEALESLRRAGLPIVYSTSVVTPHMRVLREPVATEPRAALAEILAPHGLAVRIGPAGQLIVVPARPRAEVEEPPVGKSQPPPRDGMPTLLEEIVVTPSHYRLLQEEPETRQTLTRDQIDRLPHLGGDAFWAVKRLPGTGGADVSARFNVRGGDADELLVVLDGLELYEPYHLKDFMSIFSTLDAVAIGTVDLLTGGFPVEYGDRMSGVMEVTSASPTSLPAASVSIGTINSHVLSSGVSESGWGWLVTARGWYPDLLLEGADHLADSINTDYSDLFGKIQKRVGARSALTVGYLAAWDDLGMSKHDVDEIERVDAEYRSHHLWANLTTDWSSTVRSRTVLASGNLTRKRTGAKIENDAGALRIFDDRSFGFVGVKQDWTVEAGERHLIKGGIDVKRQRARYDYATDSTFEPSTPGPGGNPSDRSFTIDLRPSGESWGVYVADRFRIAPSLVAEAGLRWDKQFWMEDNQVSPRLQLRWDSGTSIVRAAWGRYFQSQRLNELQVEDGVSEFYPAQLAEHWLASFEHHLPSGVGLRLEAYQKDLSDLRPRWENLFNPMELFPEAQTDRVLIAPDAARMRGVEILAKGSGPHRLTWWTSYVWAEAVDEIGSDRVPRNWDQRHTVNLGLDLALPRGWDAHLGAAWHSGWPATGVTVELSGDPGDPEPALVPSVRNGDRLPMYLRIDTRISRSMATRFGHLTFIGEVLNLANRKNVCCVDDYVVDGAFEITREDRFWAPVTPTFAVRWRP